jgi:uncharacterized protein (TIGR02118 family)
MIKLLAIYDHPADAEAFDRHYRDVHTPLTLRMPGLQRFELSRPVGDDAPYHLIAEMHFETAEALGRSMESPEAKAAVDDLANFAGAGVTVVTVETETVS